MSQTLIVPIRVRGLYHPNGVEVLDRVNPFELNERLSNVDMGKRDGWRETYPPNNPQHYDRTSLELEARTAEPCTHTAKLEGIHLHFMLPDVLRTSSPLIPNRILKMFGLSLKPRLDAALLESIQRQEFPRAPNRWNVTRIGPPLPYVANLIESDRFGTRGPLNGRKLYPREGKEPAPLGSKTPYAFDRNIPKEEYIPRLTAEGWGDPYFASEYSSCREIFGYEENWPEGMEGCLYSVLGWYEDSPDTTFATDVLNEFISKMRTCTNIEDKATDFKGNLWQQVILQRFGWNYTGTTLPDRVLFQADVSIARTGTTFTEQTGSIPASSAATGIEALSKHLSTMIAGHLAEDTQPAPPQPDSEAEQEEAKKPPLGQNEIEEIFEALHLDGTLGFDNLDLAFRLREARHSKEFRPHDGGRIWRIVSEDKHPDAAEAEEVTVPENLAHELNALNVAQQRYDQARDTIDSMRREVVCWARTLLLSMYCERYLGEHDALAPLKTAIADLRHQAIATGELALAMAENKHWSAIDYANLPVGFPRKFTATLAGDVVAQLRRVQDGLNLFLHPEFAQQVRVGDQTFPWPRSASFGNPITTAYHAPQSAEVPGQDRLVLQVIPGPRYYSPTTPVALVEITGFDVTGGVAAWRLETDLEVKDVHFDDRVGFSYQYVNSKEAQAPLSGFNPIYIEWQAKVKGAAENTAFGKSWAALKANLEVDDVELTLKPLIDPATGWIQPNEYTLYGRSPLSVHTAGVLEKRLIAYLERRLGAAAVDALKPATTTDRPSDVAFNLALKPLRVSDAANPCLRALRQLYKDAASGTRHLTFALNGFNDWLLSVERSYQFPLDQNGRLSKVDAAMAEDIKFVLNKGDDQIAPNLDWSRAQMSKAMLQPFEPLRSGTLTLKTVRFVDSFGRKQDWTCDDHGMTLDPRLIPPARANARWLSAANADHEMNSHPASSPICGWVVQNLLDDTLAIYAQSGDFLGYIDDNGVWRGRPGGGGAVTIGDIADLNLRKMVKHLCACAVDPDGGNRFIGDLLATLSSALENIDPEGYRQHQAQALLMGRPLALVRMHFSLELKGQAPHDFRLASLATETTRPTATVDHPNGFTTVKFPVRIGEHMHVNDGVAGFWIEKDDGYEGPFYAPQSAYVGKSDTFIEGTEDVPFAFDCSVADKPKTLAILFDPRGLLHVTTGILPTKVISIPPDQYADALKRIAITFLAAPLLVPAGRAQVSVPEEPGLDWSWIHLEDGGWRHIRGERTILKTELFHEFPKDGETVWRLLLDQNWLHLLPADEPGGEVAVVASPKDRPALTGAIADKQYVIEQVLANTGRILEAPSRSAHFTDVHELREGWMRLAMQPQSEKQPKTVAPKQAVTSR